MKRSFLFLTLALFFSSYLFSQENNDEADNTTNFNEIKLNGAFLIAGAFEVTYERTVNEESAFGISLFLPFDDNISDDIKYYISPYYRFYFGKKYAAGFFVEGFGMLNSTDRSLALISGSGDDFVTDFALGFATGGKWITKRGFSIELFVGYGRNLFNNDESDFEVIGKAGINLGYRF